MTYSRVKKLFSQVLLKFILISICVFSSHSCKKENLSKNVSIELEVDEVQAESFLWTYMIVFGSSVTHVAQGNTEKVIKIAQVGELPVGSTLQYEIHVDGATGTNSLLPADVKLSIKAENKTIFSKIFLKGTDMQLTPKSYSGLITLN
jgi:hypothetical protein